MKLLPHKQNKKEGFTLIETLVSISIFSVSVVALLSVTSSGVSSLNYTKNKLVATYLAQEGIEVVRNIRDTVAINDSSPEGWSNFLTSNVGNCLNEDGCRTNGFSSLTLSACNNNCPRLRYNTSNGTFTYGNFPQTLFTRTINVNIIDPNPEAEIISSVTWSQGTSDFEITVSEVLFDWR